MSAVAANQTYAMRLGWTPEGIVSYAHGFNTGLVAALTGLQQSLGVEPDGVFGPESYKRWLDRAIKMLNKQKLVEAGQIAAFAAKRRWLDNIGDLPVRGSADYERCRSVIDSLIRSPLGINWSWEQPYPDSVEYCGTEAADAWRQAGISLESRQFFFPSTRRLDRWFRYLPIENHKNIAAVPWQQGGRMIIDLNEHSTATEARFPDGTTPREGDIVLVGVVDSGYGTHITTIEAWDAKAGIATTIEANAKGLFPTGARGKGIIRATRRVGISLGSPDTTYHIRRIGRPGVHDIGGSL